MSRLDYLCENGHVIYSTRGPIKKCPVLRNGVPCPGALKRVGEGSRGQGH